MRRFRGHALECRFFRRGTDVWPDAPGLEGISRQLLKRGMCTLGIETVTQRIAVADIRGFSSAFLTHSSCTAVPIASIDATAFTVDAALLTTLDAVAATLLWERI